MTALTLSGTPSPDCSIGNTGDPVGTYIESPYWSWENDAGTWYLYYRPGLQTTAGWYITNILGSSTAIGWRHLTADLESPIGEFVPINEATGNPEIVEYVSPPVYAALTINDGPLAGQYIILKTG